MFLIIFVFLSRVMTFGAICIVLVVSSSCMQMYDKKSKTPQKKCCKVILLNNSISAVSVFVLLQIYV